MEYKHCLHEQYRPSTAEHGTCCYLPHASIQPPCCAISSRIWLHILALASWLPAAQHLNGPNQDIQRFRPSRRPSLACCHHPTTSHALAPRLRPRGHHLPPSRPIIRHSSTAAPSTLPVLIWLLQLQSFLPIYTVLDDAWRAFLFRGDWLDMDRSRLYGMGRKEVGNWEYSLYTRSLFVIPDTILTS